MATDLFLRIGALKGESRDAANRGWIDVLDWGWGVANRGAGRAEVRDLRFTKYVDAASCPLQRACCTGQHFADAVLVARKAGGGPHDYLTVTLGDLVVTSVTAGGRGDGDRLTEVVTVQFARVTVEYREQTPTGGTNPAGRMVWDAALNATE